MDLPDSGMGTSYPQYGAGSASNTTPLPPICQLPTELLVQVLHSVLPPVDLASKPVEPRLLAYMRRLYNMRPVMKRWHETIDGTPSFWTFVLSSLPFHVNDATILRSNNGPLAVVYSIAIGNADEHPSSGDFLRAVAHTYPRWCAYRGPVVTGYLGTPAPLLRHVTLLGKFDDDEPLELLDGCSTSLRYVDVYQVSIRWKMGLFSHLNVLKLRRVGRNGLTTGHLLDFLQASPHLELLELTDVEATSSTLHYPSAITLHLLRSIMVCACDNNVVKAILCHIRAPSCIQFWVTVFQLDEPNIPEFLDANFQHFQGSLRAIHEHVGISEIVLDSSGFQWQTLATSADSHRFYLSIDCTAPSSCIRWVERILRGDSGLSIHFGHGADVSDAVLETLAPVRCVTKALIGGNAGREETLRILRFLGKLRSVEPSLPSLPDLRELRLTSVGWDAQDLIDMIHSRFDALSWETTERPLLSITMSRGALSWTGSARPILDYAMLTKIRNTDGVSSATFFGPRELDGMLGVTWDEETSKPLIATARSGDGGALAQNLKQSIKYVNDRTDIPQYGATSDGTPNPRHEIPLPPISQLPTELLVSILHLALPLSDFSRWPLGECIHSYMPMLYTLRGVSKQWQEVVEGTPSFWALLLSTLPPHVNDTALLRSGSHPLAIVYEYPRDGSKDKYPSPEDFLSTAVKAFHRWLSYSGPALSQYLGTPTPLIQNITLIDTFHGKSTEEPLELLGGYTASLRYIEVSGVSVRWKAGLFTQLKVLDLARIGLDGLNLSAILGFLRASPQLERLRLHRVRATHDIAQSSSVITLHHLRSISIYDCDVTEDILRQIRAPSCIDFEVDVVPDSDHLVPRFLDEALHHFRGILQAIHARNGSSEVILSSSVFHWYIPGGGVDGHDFYVVIFCFSPISCIRWVEQILHSDAGLSIGFSLDADTTDIVLESIAPMRCVTKVVVEELRNKHEILRILQFISKPLTAGALVPLPCLREVWLTSAKWNDQDLLDMVQSRVNYLSLETEERPPLTISITRGALTWRNTPRPIVDYTTLNKIREINGIEGVQFVGSEELDGMLAITWNEQAGVPIWG